jgi:hypothetical protein
VELRSYRGVLVPAVFNSISDALCMNHPKNSPPIMPMPPLGGGGPQAPRPCAYRPEYAIADPAAWYKARFSALLGIYWS